MPYGTQGLSRNAVGLTEEGLNQLMRPKDILVPDINLNLDPNLKKELRDLEKHQLEDPRIHEIRRTLQSGTPARTEKFRLRNEIL
jgi:hypothetical protein